MYVHVLFVQALLGEIIVLRCLISYGGEAEKFHALMQYLMCCVCVYDETASLY